MWNFGSKTAARSYRLLTSFELFIIISPPSGLILLFVARNYQQNLCGSLAYAAANETVGHLEVVDVLALAKSANVCSDAPS